MRESNSQCPLVAHLPNEAGMNSDSSQQQQYYFIFSGSTISIEFSAAANFIHTNSLCDRVALMCFPATTITFP